MKDLWEARPALVFFAILMAMLVAPAENRVFLFHARPADFYGEIILQSDSAAMIVAKNAGSGPVSIDNADSSITLIQSRNGIVRTTALREIPSGGLAVSSVTGRSSKPRLARSDAGLFQPTPLAVTTRAEQDLFFLYVFILGGGALVLGLVLSQFATERTPQEGHR